MSESRLHRRRLTFLSRFFEVYYTDRMERERKRQELWEKIDNKSTAAQKNTEELLGYLSDLGDESECGTSKMEIIAHKIGEGDREAVGEYLRECREMTSRFPALAWMSEQAGGWLESGPATDVRKWLDDMVEYWRSRRGGDLEKVVDMADHLANDLSGRRLHQVYVELLTDTLRHIESPEKKIPIHLKIASSLKMDGQLDEALDQCEKALKISIEIDDKVGEGVALSDISSIYYAAGGLREGADLPGTVADDQAANWRRGRKRRNTKQYFANLSRAGGLRDGADTTWNSRWRSDGKSATRPGSAQPCSTWGIFTCKVISCRMR